jgi:methylmalonyl-CoA mutase C-terminal domain/subunit
MDVTSLPRKPRVLVGKIGLDGHNRGAYVVAHGLRQLGFEVIYTGLRQTAATVARAAVQEDVDVIGISSMVGAHLAIAKKLRAELEKHNALDIAVTIGGIIPKEDYEPLQALGVKRIFPTGTTVKEIAEFICSQLVEPAWNPEIPGTLAGSSVQELALVGTSCGKCGGTFFPRRRNCPHCLDDQEVKTVELSRTGTLQDCVVTKMAPPGYAVPHAQGYVELGVGGPRIFTLLTDYDEAELRAGCKMKLKCVEVGRNAKDEAVIGYRFRPA